ncbi:MAG: hypothetical protein H0T72_06830 [Chloroflexia bacterium]|nr:hypothetical protein [Chloroflexia bacterium]
MSIETWIAEQPEELIDLIVGQRWFGDKSRTRSSMRPSLILEFAHEGNQYAVLEVELEFTDGGSSTYLVPILHRSDDQAVDALRDPSFLTWLAEGFVEERSIGTPHAGGSHLVWSSIDGESSWTSQSPRMLEGEQSNTSVIFGREAILKLFRKLQPGVNPDSEIISFLTDHHAFLHVPRFLGSIALVFDREREPVELAAVQGFVPNQGDSWRWLPDALRTGSSDDLVDLLASIRLLGQRTGELHVALADSGGDAAFQPEVIDSSDVHEVEERLGREVRGTASMLHRQGACSHAESESLASSLLASVSRADALVGTLQTRVHGDYHLGQVLRTGDDFVIIDFEGEPSRPMRERRQKSSPLKDVAGMLRSIDYAVATASLSEVGAAAGLGQWRSDAERAFLDGYLPVVRRDAPALIPDSEDAFGQALDLFMIEKALYEVRYELDNRPDWLDIPFGALRRIAASN